MDILNWFYSNLPKSRDYSPRKLNLPKDLSFNLIGARGVGKSALIIDYCSKLPKDSYLYIDCQDPNFILEDLDVYDLEDFIKENKIDTLILDHYFDGFLEYMPKIKRVIVISRKESVNLDSFRLYNLDFEEFINFTKSSSIGSSFSSYTKLGSLPGVAKDSSSLFANRELFFEKFDTQEGKVLLILALFHGKVVTAHQIFQFSKEYFKISKDWLYKTIKEFQKEGIIYQIPTKDRGFGKKLFLYDFSFAKYLNKNLTYISIFDSIVALALIKHGIEAKAIIAPTSYLIEDGVLLIIAPFDSEENFWSKTQKNFSFYSNLKVKDVIIITNSSSYSFEINKIKFNALPFYEWVVGLWLLYKLRIYKNILGL